MKTFYRYIQFFSIILLIILSGCIKIAEHNERPDPPTLTESQDSLYVYVIGTDPDGDHLAYQFEFEDQYSSISLSMWTNYYPSGETVTFLIEMEDGGTYQVRVRSRDEMNEQSDYSNTVTIEYVLSGWYTQNSGTSYDLNSVCFTDANTGWVVGRQWGTILHTINGGSNWYAQNSGTIDWLYSVYFTDANTGWVVGWIILHTTDGGSNWYTQSSGTFYDLYSVHFTDANTGWIVGEYGIILHTTDGGSNWYTQNSGTSNTLNSVYFTDTNTGWVVGEYGIILHTTDGGSNWYTQSSGTSNTLNSVYFTDTNTGWVVGEYGIILHTTDGGGTSMKNNYKVVKVPTN